MDTRELIVHDELSQCPYLPDEVSCMPLRLQLERLGPEETDASLAAGDRRVGRLLYRTACPGCTACEPLRIGVSTFEASRSQRRILRRNEDVRMEVAEATLSARHLELFNRHRLERRLTNKGRPMRPEEYVGWFVQSCVRTVEMRYTVDDRLVGVGIVDVGARDTSSVYYYFDPDESHRSLGTFSALTEIDWLRKNGGRYHYLGLFVADCSRLNYKGRFHPHERQVDGVWTRFER